MLALPIMRWLKERGGPLGAFSQALLLRVPAGLAERDLMMALGALLDHHDALRLRLDAAADGQCWRLEVPPPGAVRGAVLLRRVDIGGLDPGPAMPREAIAARGAQAAEQRPRPRTTGVMLQAVWFDAGAARAGRLLLVIHHLAVDGVSWRILVPDLEAAWRAIAAGQPVSLPPRGTSFRRWAARLAEHAQSAALCDELAFWRGQQDLPSLLLTDQKLDPARDRLGIAAHLSLRLPHDVTQALLTRVPAAFHGGIDDVLLTALALAVADWCRRHVQGAAGGRAGSHAVLIDLEGHGREDIFADVDLTRTVGWFTSLYPVRLDPGAIDLGDALGGGAALGRAVKTVKEQLRAVPGKGLGYGLLRYLGGDTAPSLPALAHARSSASTTSGRLGAGRPEGGRLGAGRRKAGAVTASAMAGPD